MMAVQLKDEAPAAGHVRVTDEMRKAMQDLGPKITVDGVLEAARDPRSPLHLAFIWDDSIAAEMWRRNQAIKLINDALSVQIKAKEDRPVGQFWRIPGNAYVDMQRASITDKRDGLQCKQRSARCAATLCRERLEELEVFVGPKRKDDIAAIIWMVQKLEVAIESLTI